MVELRWDGYCHATCSFFVKAVRSLFVDGSRSEKALKEGIKVIVGNGERVRFWSELVSDSIPLKRAFP